MKRENLLIGLVVFLVALNGFTLFRLSSRRPPGPPPHDKIIVKTLGFDEEQQRQFEKLKFGHRSGIIAIEDEVEKTLEQYFLLLNHEDQGKRDSLENILGDLERQKASLTYKHFADIKALCRPEQQKVFEAFIPRLSKFILPQGPKNLPPRPKD